MLQCQADFDELVESLGERLKHAMEEKSYLDPRKDQMRLMEAERKIDMLKTMIRQAETDFYKDVTRPDGPASRN